MKKVFRCLAFIAVLAGCKTPCSDPGSVASLLTGAVVNKWQCTNAAQVQSDIGGVCATLGLCAVPAKGKDGGPIANVACPLVVGELQKLGGNAVPQSWGCNPSLVGANAAVGLTALCEMLPF